jgi:hypothetical protein
MQADTYTVILFVIITGRLFISEEFFILFFFCFSNFFFKNNYYRSLLFKDKPKPEYCVDLAEFRNQRNSIEKSNIKLKTLLQLL